MNKLRTLIATESQRHTLSESISQALSLGNLQHILLNELSDPDIKTAMIEALQQNSQDKLNKLFTRVIGNKQDKPLKHTISDKITAYALGFNSDHEMKNFYKNADETLFNTYTYHYSDDRYTDQGVIYAPVNYNLTPLEVAGKLGIKLTIADNRGGTNLTILKCDSSPIVNPEEDKVVGLSKITIVHCSVFEDDDAVYELTQDEIDSKCFKPILNRFADNNFDAIYSEDSLYFDDTDILCSSLEMKLKSFDLSALPAVTPTTMEEVLRHVSFPHPGEDECHVVYEHNFGLMLFFSKETHKLVYYAFAIKDQKDDHRYL